MKPVQRSKVYRKFCEDHNGATGASTNADGSQRRTVVALFATDLAARGLDIADVDWVVQYDPPQDPDTFVHRVGRTARMGREGAALSYLLPTEDAYVDFMKVRRVPLQAWNTAEAPLSEGTRPHDSLRLLDQVKSATKRDRDLFEKGERAFVSYVAGYQEHTCNFIFRWAAMDIGQLAVSFALLRLPRLKFKDISGSGDGNTSKNRSKGKKKKQRSDVTGAKEGASALPDIDFVRDSIDTNLIPYKDKQRERQRQSQLKLRGTGSGNSRTHRQCEGSPDPEAATEMPDAKRLKPVSSQTGVSAASSSIAELAASTASSVGDVAAVEMLRSAVTQELEDEDDIMRESRLLKKLKSKKITEAEFDAQMAALEQGRESARAIAHRKDDDRRKKKAKHGAGTLAGRGRPDKKQSQRQRRSAKTRRATNAISKVQLKQQHTR